MHHGLEGRRSPFKRSSGLLIAEALVAVGRLIAAVQRRAGYA
jgi:hypothetical protein